VVCIDAVAVYYWRLFTFCHVSQKAVTVGAEIRVAGRRKPTAWHMREAKKQAREVLDKAKKWYSQQTGIGTSDEGNMFGGSWWSLWSERVLRVGRSSVS
jgi:hypothetical protein